MSEMILELKTNDKNGYSALASISRTLIAHADHLDSPTIIGKALVDTIAGANFSYSESFNIIARWLDGFGWQLAYLESRDHDNPVGIWYSPREVMSKLWMFDKLS